jgi:hypothetical protein
MQNQDLINRIAAKIKQDKFHELTDDERRLVTSDTQNIIAIMATWRGEPIPKSAASKAKSSNRSGLAIAIVLLGFIGLLGYLLKSSHDTIQRLETSIADGLHSKNKPSKSRENNYDDNQQSSGQQAQFACLVAFKENYDPSKNSEADKVLAEINEKKRQYLSIDAKRLVGDYFLYANEHEHQAIKRLLAPKVIQYFTLRETTPTVIALDASRWWRQYDDRFEVDANSYEITTEFNKSLGQTLRVVRVSGQYFRTPKRAAGAVAEQMQAEYTMKFNKDDKIVYLQQRILSDSAVELN